jgi:hypothetical protein
VIFPSVLRLFFILFGTGFEVLKVVRGHTRSGLGRRIIWYMVVNVLEEHSVCVFTALQKMKEYVLTETTVHTNHIT